MLTILLHLLNETVNFVASSQQGCHIFVVKQNDVYVLFLTTVFSNIQARYFHHYQYVSFLYMDVIDPYASYFHK